MELRQCDVQSGKKHRREKRQIFGKANKSSIVAAVGIVIHALKFLDEQTRDKYHRRRTVDNNRDPAFGQLAADRIGTLRDTHTRKQAAGLFVLEVIGQIAGSENRLQIAGL